MAITKTPFFGLASHGTVGQVLTSQKRDSSTLLRKKPLPGYRYTLPQAYQRWLYEDYAYLWTQQTTATRAEYRSGGSRFHLTGFQYWMKVMLSTLPDIAGWWKLDEGSGAVAHDSSRNDNHGTIFGASPATGLIDGADYFDGLNDKIVVPDHPSLDLTTSLTFECLIKPGPPATYWIFEKASGITPATTEYFCFLSAGIPLFYISDHVAYSVVTGVTVMTPGTWYHLAATYDQVNLRLYVNGIEDVPPTATNKVIPVTLNDVWFGERRNGTLDLDGTIDNAILYNRALDATEILRHSLRRYPPQ